MRSKVRSELLEKAKNLAIHSGVYLMKEASGQILYVGKAKSLKSRVSSYFQPVVHEHPRTELMLSNVLDFEVIHTETEQEALILECTLIKRYKPKFNVRLKDDKHYPYLRILVDLDFPRIEWTRKVGREHARYFGPFPSSFAARTTLRLLTESFKLRACSDNTFLHRSRPCILYQMDQCTAPCVGKVSRDEYHSQVKEVIDVLQGKGQRFMKGLKAKMHEAAGEQRFEDAARLRDEIQAVEVVAQTQSVSDVDDRIDVDVYACEKTDQMAHGVLLQVRGGKLLSVRHYDIQNFDGSLSEGEVLRDFLTQHFLLMQTRTDLKPAEAVLMRGRPEDCELLEEALHVKIKTPTTNKENQLVTVAHTNARYAIENAKRAGRGHGVVALEEIADKLGLKKLPRRIECYDISNTQGEDSVASRVVFVDGSPDKNLYRRYKIKTVKGANDFASMKEIFERRFSKMDQEPGNEAPDLVVVDGGKGQLAQAEAIFKEFDIQGVDLVGLAKARTESDFQSKEVQSTMERIFIPNRVNPIPLYPTTHAYKLLTHIRDEAHRFAITYHRKLRDRRSIKGKL